MNSYIENENTLQECTESELATRPPQWNEYPTVFLSPENKGFE